MGAPVWDGNGPLSVELGNKWSPRCPRRSCLVPTVNNWASSEDPPAPERSGWDAAAQGMDFPSSLRNGTPRPTATIAHHSQRLPKALQTDSRAPGSSSRRCCEESQDLGRAGRGSAFSAGAVEWDREPSQVGSILYPIPTAALATPLALNCVPGCGDGMWER